MKILTDAQYNEMLDLVEQANIRISLESVHNLVDDIDAPIKRCVAMFALLGFEPTYSCCGFDYVGQPYHKHHQYDEPYIQFKLNERSRVLIDAGHIGEWKVKKLGSNVYCLRLVLDQNPHWRNKNCIHSSEESVLQIQILENQLLQLANNFYECIWLYDTNNKNRLFTKFWQYTPKAPWYITKEDVLNDNL